MNNCSDCGKRRTCNNDGQCHECGQAERDAATCAECNSPKDDCRCIDGPWIPGGRRL